MKRISYPIGAVLLLAICSLLNLSLNAQCTAPGWASQNGGTTGGGSATASVVSTYADLKNALSSASIKVIHIQGAITIPAGGRINIQDQTGKTVYGLPGSKLITRDQTASGSGIFYVKRCSNMIFRNLNFDGAGAYDVDGNDNMTLDNCTNIWVDHCEFHDGLDGNLDIKNASDFISVTYTKFSYEKAPRAGGPGGADDHRFSNLLGSSDAATQDAGKLSVTFYNCWWAQGCVARMPRVRFGKVHIVNSLFSSTTAKQCIIAAYKANLLVEGNVFKGVTKPIDLFNNDFTAITARNNLFINTSGNTAGSGTAFSAPYTLSIALASTVEASVTASAGANLTSNSCGTTTPVNKAPTVSLTAPANNASFTAPASISIAASAGDADGTVSKVEFYNGSTLLASDASSPYSFSWANVAAGTYSITAKATDNSGAVTTSSAVSISVTTTTPVNKAPTVSLTAPANNASFTAPATISIAASAADADGTISKVDFYNGSTLLGSDASSPYSFSWANVAAGTYSITAKATDNSGAVTTSSAVSISVTTTTPVNKAPTVSLTAPANNASFTAPASISIAASAADADGTVSKVEFYNGSTLLGSDASSPYSFSWANVAAGTYSITAKATDNSGAVTTSSAVSITVTTATSTAEISGSDCLNKNATATYTLSSSLRTNATSYNWWYTGSAQSIAAVSGTPYQATITTGAGFGAGQVCVGVNYSVSPWYSQYCKNISLCSAREGNTETLSDETSAITTVHPNPSTAGFSLELKKEANHISVLNQQGLMIWEHNQVEGTRLELGEDWNAGMYFVNIRYASGESETIKLSKIK